MQPDYRTILSEMLLAQSAAAGAFADIAGRYSSLMAEIYGAAFATLGSNLRHNSAGSEPSLPGGAEMSDALLPWSADVSRAVAGLPRLSMMSFLARYDALRRRRSGVGGA